MISEHRPARNRDGFGGQLKIALLLSLLPLVFVAPLLLNHKYGPALPLGADPRPTYFLDLWSVLAIATSALGALPGAVSAYRWRGGWASVTVLAWLLGLSVLAYRAGLWIT